MSVKIQPEKVYNFTYTNAEGVVKNRTVYVTKLTYSGIYAYDFTVDEIRQFKEHRMSNVVEVEFGSQPTGNFSVNTINAIVKDLKNKGYKVYDAGGQLVYVKTKDYTLQKLLLNIYFSYLGHSFSVYQNAGKINVDINCVAVGTYSLDATGLKAALNKLQTSMAKLG